MNSPYPLQKTHQTIGSLAEKLLDISLGWNSTMQQAVMQKCFQMDWRIPSRYALLALLAEVTGSEALLILHPSLPVSFSILFPLFFLPFNFYFLLPLSLVLTLSHLKARAIALCFQYFFKSSRFLALQITLACK